MATTTATNSSQASPSPFPVSMLTGFPPRSFQTTNNTSASPSSTPISSTSTSSTVNGSGVFPNGAPSQQQLATGLFNPNYYAAFMQSQVMQQFMKQYMVGMTGADNSQGNVDSRSPSTTTASPSIGQQQKKLFLDPDGNILCPICEQKVGPDSWTEHLKLERDNLSKTISSLKENKRPNALFNNPTDGDNLQPVSDQRRKREFELTRIRSNQQKRLSMKGTLMSSSVLRDTTLLMPQNTTRMPQSGKFLIGSLCETPSPRSASELSARNGDVEGVDRNFCKSCKRTHEFLIIANGLDEPRCMDCYRKYRRQVGALPLTITESPTDDPTIQVNGHRHGSHTTSSASPVQRDASGSASGTPHDEDDIFATQNGDDMDEETPLKRPKLDISLTSD